MSDWSWCPSPAKGLIVRLYKFGCAGQLLLNGVLCSPESWSKYISPAISIHQPASVKYKSSQFRSRSALGWPRTDQYSCYKPIEVFTLLYIRPVCLIPFGRHIRGNWVTIKYDLSSGNSPILPDLRIQPSTLTQNTSLVVVVFYWHHQIYLY